MITNNEFLRIVSFLKQRYGIDMSQKKVIMNGRLENYLRSGGWSSFDAYMNDVEKDESGELEKMLVNFLTTNHTYFMREFGHFEFFKNVVLPWIKKKEERSKDMRIWCGASSTGEEPYMIAMVVNDFLGLEHKNWDARILATDISTQALSYVATDELKKEVIYRKFNLMEPFPFRKKMHTIFLRNVMIYFDEATKRQVVQKVYDALEPGGYLFIGMTETLDRSSTPFQLVQPSIFKK